MAIMDAYVRVSSKGKREGDSYRSPALQLDTITHWSAAEGVTLGLEEVEENVSGGKAVKDRKLEKLIARAEAGVTEGVVVDTLDRFGRDELDAALAIKRLKDVGARVVAAREGIDSSRDDPGSKMALRIFLMMAEAYLDRVRSNWKKASESAAQDGIQCARAPIGYLRKDQVEPEFDARGKLIPNGRLLVDPAVAKAVVRAFELRAEGASYTEATAPLEAALGRRLSRNTLARMVDNRTYLGEIHRGDLVTKGAHEAIVTPELFAAAKRKAAYKPRTGALAEQALLSGIVRCASCGRRMKVQGGASSVSYVCQPHRVEAVCQSPAAASVAAVDALVTHVLTESWEEVVEASGSEEAAYLIAREAVAAAESELEEWMADKAATGPTRRQMILRAEDALTEARTALYDLPDPGVDDAPVVWLDGKPVAYTVWGDDREADRRVLRKFVQSVEVSKADPKRRRWQPVEERVSVAWRGRAPVALAA